MRNTIRKYSRRHGTMVLRSYAPGDGSIDFNWVSERDSNGPVLEEPVTESDVSEWLALKENAERFQNWEIIVLGRCSRNQVPYDVRIVQLVERPFGTSKRLVMAGVEYEYVYHGNKLEDAEDFGGYHASNTDFYAVEQTGRRSNESVGNGGIISGLCFFLNHEKDFEANGYRTRETKRSREHRERLRDMLKPVPESMVGECVGHHPDRRIFREVDVYDDDPSKPSGKRLVKAHSRTSIEKGDLWMR